MSEKKLNLYEKIQAVSNEIKNLQKDIQVGSGNYAYRAVSDQAVTLAVKEAETKYGILSIPYGQELINTEVLRTIKNGNENIKFVDTIKMTIRIIDIEDIKSYLDIISYGKGIDNGDKGFGKASTYARKYALLNAYKIATGEDPDNNKSEVIKTPSTVSDKRKIVLNYFEKNTSKVPAILKHFNIDSIEDLTDFDIDLTYRTYHEKNLL